MPDKNLEQQIEHLENEQAKAEESGDFKRYDELEKKIDRILDILDKAEQALEQVEDDITDDKDNLPETVASIIDNPASSTVEAVKELTGGDNEQKINWL